MLRPRDVHVAGAINRQLNRSDHAAV